MFHCKHLRILLVLGAAMALGGWTTMPALAQCEHFHPQTLLGMEDPNNADSVAIGDLDGDGDADVAIVHYAPAGRLTLLFNAGDATFPDEVTYAAGDSPEEVAIGELNGQDGLDMVVVNYNSDYATLYLNDGAGGFTASTIPTELGAYRVAIGDLDGDGDNDLVTIHPGEEGLGFFALHLNNGDATFVAGDTYGTTYIGPYGVAVADLDGANGLDIVATNLGWSFDQFLNNGDGTFTQEIHGTASTSYTVDVVAADVDDDGDNDLGMAHWWASGAGSAYLNYGDATYAGSAYGTGAYACEEAEFADLDGQPGLEFIILNRSGSAGPPGLVSVWTNDGMGGFSNRCDYEAGQMSLSVAVGDLNGDSATDAVVANNFGGCSLLLNQGPAPCPGDVDGDGDTDLTDLAALLSAYGSVPGDPNWNPACDFDADDDVDLSDLAFLLSDYGCG